MTVVGLAGYARTGKDTVADLLCEEHGFRRIAFADALRAAALALDPYVRVPLDLSVSWNVAGMLRLSELLSAVGYHEAKSAPDVRRLYQRLGTEVGRNVISDTVWVDIVQDQILSSPPHTNWVITDVRFTNEAEMLVDLDVHHDRRAFLCRVMRPGYGPVNGHSSETGLDGWRHPSDYQISNDGSLEDLEAMVEQLASWARCAPAHIR